MFTGIVQSIGIVRAFQRRSGGARLVVETGLPEELLRIGDSIAVDGCCQTIVQADGTVCTFDCLEETLRRSVFGEYVPGRPVNIEPALAVGDRLGGHIVQGHVDCVQPVVELRERQGDSTNQKPAPVNDSIVTEDLRGSFWRNCATYFPIRSASRFALEPHLRAWRAVCSQVCGMMQTEKDS